MTRDDLRALTYAFERAEGAARALQRERASLQMAQADFARAQEDYEQAHTTLAALRARHGVADDVPPESGAPAWLEESEVICVTSRQ